jgi:hypothetical protein
VDAEAERRFREFVAGRSAALFRLAYILTGDHHQAEDLLQTALVRTAPTRSRCGSGCTTPCAGSPRQGLLRRCRGRHGDGARPRLAERSAADATAAGRPARRAGAPAGERTGVRRVPDRRRLRRSGGPRAGTHLADPRTGTYSTFPVSAQISPDGRKAVYPEAPATGRTGELPTDRVTIEDLLTDQKQAISLPWAATAFAWSPDSGTVLGTVVSAAGDPATSRSRRLGFVLLRPGADQPTFVPVATGGCGGESGDDPGDVEADAFGWRGGEVYALRSDPDRPHSCVLTYYGLDGVAHRSLPWPGEVVSVSPDRSLLLVLDREPDPAFGNAVADRYRVVDAVTGRRLGAFPANETTGTPLAWMDGRHLFTRQGGSGTPSRLVATDVNGHVTRVLSRWGRALDLQFIPVGP